jgi:hypothetical protein
MNVWKPIAMCSIAAFVGSVGVQVAKADGACHNQPNMEAARQTLKQARAALDRAEHNKGGWRDRAIASTDAALREAEKGCEFADTH